MHRPSSSRRLALGLLAALPLLAGCSEIVPRFELRDDYMGKRFLQPGRVPGEIERDAYGNPILPRKPATGAP
jgi:hypothetical protein